MKKLILIIIFTFLATFLLAKSDTTKVAVDTVKDTIKDTIKNAVKSSSQICGNRGHIIVEFQIYRENVKSQSRDYPDSTVMYYYEDNKQTGIMKWCKRCKNWIGLPVLDSPKTKTIWSKKYEKNTMDTTGSDTTGNN